MNAGEWTTVIGLILTAIGTVVFPLYLYRKSNSHSSSQAAVLDSTAVARMMRDERDHLQSEMRQQKLDHESMMTDLQGQLIKQRIDYEGKIAELRTEISGLYRQLYQKPVT